MQPAPQRLGLQPDLSLELTKVEDTRIPMAGSVND